jgi:alkanesulfonate monooxygenase SsuD/methylene tetrahydromethanopterin reductase-like flavin-dependent oxidoreductase (luciferase family)
MTAPEFVRPELADGHMPHIAPADKKLRMRFGYFMMPVHVPGSDVSVTLESDLAQVERLDELGFDEAWIGEHFTAEWENIPAPDIFIAAALQRTTTIALGTGVSCLPNHNPFQLAHRIAMLDNLAHGRFFWGIGSGGFPGDFDVVGIDPKTGIQRQITFDTLDAVLALWDDPQPGTYQRHSWTFRVPEPDPRIGKRVWMKPYQRPHPPIAVAGITPKSDTLGLAGERGWIPLSINFATPQVLRSHWASIEAGAARTGRKPNRADWRIARALHVAETDEQARREAIEGAIGRDYRDCILPGLAQGIGFGPLKIDASMPDSAVTLEYLLDNVWVVGSPETVVRKIRKLYDDVGGFGGLLIGGSDWQDPAVWDRSMRLFAAEVAPRVADLVPSAIP